MKRNIRLEMQLSEKERDALRSLVETSESNASQVIRQLILQAAAKLKREAA